MNSVHIVVPLQVLISSRCELRRQYPLILREGIRSGDDCEWENFADSGIGLRITFKKYTSYEKQENYDNTKKLIK